jgi:hypothetical protein
LPPLSPPSHTAVARLVVIEALPLAPPGAQLVPVAGGAGLRGIISSRIAR